jgi:hypothetical protein
MHYRHVIMVEASSPEDAIEAAEEGIAPYGMGEVWDYYIVGGRWEGNLNGRNVVCLADDQETFMQALIALRAEQQEEFLRLRRRLKGDEPGPPPEWLNNPLETLSESGGLVTERTRRWMEIESVNIARVNGLWKTLMTCENLDAVDGNESGLWDINKFLDLVRGKYTSSSMFFWTNETSARASAAIEYVNKLEDKDKARMYLVVMDLHN